VAQVPAGKTTQLGLTPSRSGNGARSAAAAAGEEAGDGEEGVAKGARVIPHDSAQRERSYSPSLDLRKRLAQNDLPGVLSYLIRFRDPPEGDD
jgi:hypothetical protein